ncbi:MULTISPECIES: hypothetical protein [Oscillatoriales]|uniref:Uncharacterized protein n=1 Tax=Limnospira platensis NIES-46 TaxID=1236695 RepID=A0A5M3T621_LIMPL|nr:hypothetical protein [Arthrospira platensis]MDF2209166.1 hypothetical protein [Arthrospira platensis NCB002]MDT9181281.1 hypothetical protein [Limnospira sp. PMC 289.06]MDT9293526.1 hypothetical protein [Arthrospira platensis PCC 7345]BDT10483.1 hypothetical protein N39L_02060 [Arthrospira platensis NIES-39]GCE94924.1 hypothetical protein NIES46_29840 [Arthrospira platensis NIES-46]
MLYNALASLAISAAIASVGAAALVAPSPAQTKTISVASLDFHTQLTQEMATIVDSQIMAADNKSPEESPSYPQPGDGRR